MVNVGADGISSIDFLSGHGARHSLRGKKTLLECRASNLPLSPTPHCRVPTLAPPLARGHEVTKGTREHQNPSDAALELQELTSVPASKQSRARPSLLPACALASHSTRANHANNQVRLRRKEKEASRAKETPLAATEGPNHPACSRPTWGFVPFHSLAGSLAFQSPPSPLLPYPPPFFQSPRPTERWKSCMSQARNRGGLDRQHVVPLLRLSNHLMLQMSGADK